MSGGAPFPYRPALDGIRALAVTAVLLYHGGIAWAPGGFVGIDVFFVLSGYLITGLLLAERAGTGRLDLPAFWARRALRLLPALFLTLAGVAVFAERFASALQLERLRGDALATLAYVANWRFLVADESYFARGDPSPLRHAWSLAIEEQWYLLWPLLLLALFALLGRRRRALLLPVVIGAAVLSAALMVVVYDGGDPSRVYYGTDTRVQALLLGAALAVALERRRFDVAPGRTVAVSGVVALALLGVVVATLGDLESRTYDGGLTLVAVVSAVLVWSCVAGAGPVPAMLSWSPLRWLGRASYGVYLYHWPIFVTLTSERTGWSGYGLFGLRVAVTLAVATVSYHLVEMPVRQGRLAVGRRGWLALGASVVGIVAVLAVTTRDAGETQAPTAIDLSERDVEGTVLDGPADGSPFLAAADRVLVVGDSAAFTIGEYLGAEHPQEAQAAGDAVAWDWWASIGCGLLPGDPWSGGRPHSVFPGVDCSVWPDEFAAAVERFDPDVSVVMIGAWEVFDHEVDGVMVEVGTAEHDALLTDALDRGSDILTADGGRVVLLTVQCMENFNAELKGNQDWERTEADRVEALNRVITAVGERRDDVAVLDFNTFMCPDGEFDVERDGVVIHSDGVHFTTAGAALVWQWLLAGLDTLAT